MSIEGGYMFGNGRTLVRTPNSGVDKKSFRITRGF